MLEAQLAVEKETRIAKPLQLHPLFGPDRPEQVSLGASLVLEEVTSMLCILREFEDIFGLSHANIPWVLPELTEHRLSLRSGCRPVRKRLRWFHPARQE